MAEGAGCADDRWVKLFRRPPAEPEPPRIDGRFGEWLLRQFSRGTPMATQPYAEVERLCANAGSVLFGAVYANPGAFEAAVPPVARLWHDAALLSRRTADGFKASLADRKNAVIAWPWDHLATSITWGATRTETVSEAALGEELMGVGGAYALRHREQLTAVFDLWQQIAGNVRPTAEPPDLARMGSEMFAAFRGLQAPPPG